MKLLDRIIFKLFRYRPTYSQCGEDMIIGHVLRMFNRDKINYLDIGTNHPKIFNNTYLFYLNGGNGVCVEPNPILCNKIKKHRPKDVCLNIGIGPNTTDMLDFYMMDVDTLSTFSKKDAEKLQASGKYKITETLGVPMMNINELISKYFKTPPDLVSIDVEDLNEEIVLGIDFIVRPLIYCIETVSFDTGGKIESINKHLLNNDYFVYADTHINTIFVDKKIWKNI